jgi:hypothetical protein
MLPFVCSGVSRPRKYSMRELNTMSRVPLAWPPCRKLTDLTGGRKLFEGDGRMRAFRPLRDRPVQRQFAPLFGSRINSGYAVGPPASSGMLIFIIFFHFYFLMSDEAT